MATVTISSSTATAGTNTKLPPTIHFDPSYMKTIPGILKIAQAAVSVIGFICVQTIPYSLYRSAGGWYSFVSATGFWVSLLILIFYVFHIVEKLSWLPWLLVETAYAAVWAGFYFIASCVAAVNGKHDPGWGAAAFFGFVAMFIFGYEAFLKYRSWRAGESPQGEKATSDAETITPTGPSYPTY